jgi:hypothetical protein
LPQAPDRSDDVENLRWIGFGAFFVSSFVIGVRLLLLARLTGKLPEFLIGIGVLGIGPFGYGLSMLAFVLASHSLALSATLMGSALLGATIGAISQYLFAWTVFRRDASWARAVVWIAISLLLADYVGDLVENGLVNRRSVGAWFWLGAGLRTAGLGWSALESLRYHRIMRLRTRLGLADPIVTESFRLWGLGAGAAFAGSLLGVMARALTGHGAAEFPVLNLMLSLLGLVAAVAMWLAFLPPGAYQRFVEARNRRAAALPSAPA